MEDLVFRLGKKEKMTEDNGPVDRISELPDEVIHNILSLVPTKYAIRSGVLSKRWKNRWTLSHNLDIESNPDVIMAVSSVNKCIKKHKAKDIHKFRLSFFVETSFNRKIKDWIKIAMRKHVQELTIHVTRIKGEGPSDFSVPQSLLSYKPLQLLDLNTCNFILTPDFGGFPSLKTFRVQYSDITEETLMILLSRCPLLENFYIMSCPNIKSLKLSFPNVCLKDVQVNPSKPVTEVEIDAPDLQIIRCGGDIEFFCLVNTPPLLSVCLFPCLSENEHPPPVIREWASSIANISKTEYLKSNIQLLRLQYAGYAMNGRSSRTIFRNLKTFEMISPILATYDASAVINFLGSCPSLETIQLNLASRLLPDTVWLTEYLEVEQVQPIEEERIILPNSSDGFCRLDHLRTVKVMFFSGKLKEMRVLAYIIQKAANLEELILNWSYEGYTHNRRNIVGELHKTANRFSSHVKITPKDMFGLDGFDDMFGQDGFDD